MSDDSQPLWVKAEKVYLRCPKCKVGHLDRRVPRDFFVKHVLFWMDIKRYRCNNCWAKVYIRRKAGTQKKIEPTQ